MSELWEPIGGWEDYDISSEGKVRRNGRVLKNQSHRQGYQYLILYCKGECKPFLIHRLVALHFLPIDTQRLYVNHKDGNKKNNSIHNLEWCTPEENELHALEHGLKSKVKGEARFWNAKITEEAALSILHSKGKLTARQLSDKFGVSAGHIRSIWSGAKWAHIQ